MPDREPKFTRLISSLFMHDRTARTLSTLHTLLYRITRGRLGRRLVDNDMLLLTTTGRISGKTHTVPLLYLEDGGALVVIASWGGRPDHPHWYENLVTQPSCFVTLPGRRFPATARTASPDERHQWWPKVVAAYDGYATYQSRTDREIPIVYLEPVQA